MAMHLSNFRIQGLYNRRTIELAISDNKLVLVGDNGSGKTTIINILYYFLSRQWDRLATYNFEVLTATINGEEVSLFMEQLRKAKERKHLQTTLLHDSFYRSRKVRNLLAHADRQELLENRDQLLYISDELNIPLTVLIDIFSRDTPDDIFKNISKRMNELITEQILYLPTYRRIEQDLKTIFPTIDTKELLRRDRYSSQHPENYIELVEFGMEDVERRITQKLNSLKDDIRNRLDALTASYLRDVISGQYKSVEAATIEKLPAEAVESIINRIGNDILPEADKARLRKILAEIQQMKIIEDDQKVIAHFLIRLVELYNNQQRAETKIRRFTDVCNNYLTGKQLVFDNSDFNVFIELRPQENEREHNDSAIEMQQLSSGEKQIVSLFSHLFLSDIKEFFVLIDEPELSLSVPWQKRFLPDIIDTGYCNGLIAATHSPFIFDNEFDPYTHSINEFWSEP